MVSDRLKDCLPAGALTYVLSQEGDECYSSEKIAELAVIHVNNFQEEKYKGNAVTNFDLGNQMSKFKPRFTSSWQGKNTEHAGQGKKAEPIATEVAKAYGPLRICFNCNSPKHIARDYSEKKKVSKNKPYTVKQCLVVDSFNRDVSLETSFEKLSDVVDCAFNVVNSMW